MAHPLVTEPCEILPFIPETFRLAAMDAPFVHLVDSVGCDERGNMGATEQLGAGLHWDNAFIA
jgi:hypothetical protein